MLATHAQFRRGEQAIDDVVVLPHSMIDELTIALGPDHKQRRRLSLYDSTGHLDIDFRTVVERGDRAPGRIVAFNRERNRNRAISTPVMMGVAASALAFCRRNAIS